jgi:SAM-dependent methyltransferase
MLDGRSALRDPPKPPKMPPAAQRAPRFVVECAPQEFHRMSITRRRFVLTSLATPIAASLGGGLAAQIASGTAPAFLRNGLGQNEKLRVLKVGCGGMGASDLGEVASHKMVEIVGLVDIDQNQIDRWKKDSKNDKGETIKARFPDAAEYRDWREAYAKMGDKFDAVVCSTADHMHAPISMAAMNLGKHVYCQKPLAQGAWENRRLAEVAATMPNIVADGHAAHRHQVAPLRRHAAARGRDRSRQGGLRVDQPSRGLVAAGQPAPRGRGSRARASLVGPLPGHRAVASVQERLHALRVARHDRLRHGCVW